MSTKKSNLKAKKDFAWEILNKIKKEDIKQIPKHVFIFKHVLIWIFLFLSILIWAISLSINFEYIIGADWFLFQKIWIIKIALIFLPIFWILFLIIATFLSYYNFKHTEKWYKYSFSKILWINIFLSIILWWVIFITWTNQLIESSLESIIPNYRSVLVEDKNSRMIKVWQNEESGLLLWEILEMDNNNLKFIDYNNKKWDIQFSNQTDIKWRVNLNIWEKIKIIWEKNWENAFSAIEIRPFSWKSNNWGSKGHQ